MSCSTTNSNPCKWVEENLITSLEANKLSVKSKRNITIHEKNYDKFCK